MTDQPQEHARWMDHIGPALILATVVIGPGSLTLNTIAGGTYGYQLLWVPAIGTIFMLVFTWIAARIGLVTGRTLFDLTRQAYGRGLAALGSFGGFLAVLAFQAGNSAAVGFAAAAILGGDFRVWAAVFTLVGLALVFLPNLYEKLELLVKVVVGLMLVTFAGTLLMVGIDVPEAANGLIPNFPDADAALLTLGMAATTFSVVGAVYQGYLMREKAWGTEHLASESIDSLIGISVLGLISTIILLTSAAVMQGADTFSAQAMAMQLEPLVGSFAFYLFTFGFFFASLSSLIVNPLIGGTLLADGLNQETKMEGRPVRIYTAIAILVGLAIVLVFDGSPIELLRFAQGVAVIAFPVLGFLILAIGRNRELMGVYVTPLWVHAIAIVGYAVLIAIVINYVRIILA
ncbi:Nramp family divalent metal transporter [Allorhodopirellula solitaria]|uniref:Divalent metal cation transporter MntH n=1 Tax=Allorhodopirellula solitaria TaxID=2527987 RepID=A0A5C5YEG1_9BACT|nr:Nramp family divalent metal transporter [Allorhodopirellula solitaria]TWT74136.1 Divalent metal cation transporter MntH [Allorhodopirellula solitaria]